MDAINLTDTIKDIRDKAVSIAGEHWAELGELVDSTLPDPLNPFVLLPIATGVAVGGQVDKLIPVASTVVLIDMALRIIDDCADQDSPHALYRSIGMGRSMNIAMAIQSVAARMLSRLELSSLKSNPLIERYYLTLFDVYQGQDYDMRATMTDLKGYQQIVELKTVKAYEFTTMIGAYVSTNNVALLKRCVLCGVHLGWMTQIVNDIVGLWLPENIGMSELQKKTFPIHLALSLNHPNTKILNEMYTSQNLDYNQILTLLDAMDIKTRLMHEALDHRDQALMLLDNMPNPEGKVILEHWLNWYLSDIT